MSYHSTVSELTWYVPFGKKFLVISLSSSWRTLIRKHSPAGSWVRHFFLMAVTWYQSNGIYQVFDILSKVNHPKHAALYSLPQIKFLIQRSSLIWLQLFKALNSRFFHFGNISYDHQMKKKNQKHMKTKSREVFLNNHWPWS